LSVIGEKKRGGICTPFAKRGGICTPLGGGICTPLKKFSTGLRIDFKGNFAKKFCP
jgi:hypothetical protein